MEDERREGEGTTTKGESEKTVAHPRTADRAPAESEPVVYASEYERLRALAIEAVPGTILEDDPNKPYTIGVWGPEGNKFPNLCCRLCKFAIVANKTGPYARQFMEHWGANHEPDEDEPTAGNSGLVDASGRPL